MALTKITDHVSAALARLPEQHKDKVNFPALVSALVTPAQTAENVFFDVLTQRAIDNAIGAQLDVIGRIVGIDRDDIDSGLSDSEYRRYVRAKIWAQKSDGVPNDILRVMDLVINDPTATLVLEQYFPAGITFRVEDVGLPDSVSDIAAQFLCDVTAAGVRCLFESNLNADTLRFKTAIATTLNGPEFDDNGSFVVQSTAGFPSSGTIRLSEGVSSGIEVDLTYSGITATQFLGCSTGPGNAHPDGSTVRLVRTPDQGFPANVTQLNGAYSGGATMTVDDTTGFPTNGTLVLSKGDSGDIEETVTYTGKTATTFTGCTASLSNSHPDNAAVYLLDSGGKLSSVKEG